MNLQEALRVLDAYELDAFLAARSVARRGAASLLAEAEPELSHPVSEGQVIAAMRVIVANLGDIEATRRLWKRYQATCAFYMIDAGRREYESGALYPRIAEELGINVEQYVNRWADHFVDFLDFLQLQRFSFDSAAKYKLESILLHGGLPDDAWRQVWENWLLPGVRAGHREPDQLIEWALSTSHDAPQLRTTTRDILHNGGSVVRRLVEEAVEAASDSLETGVVDESKDYGLPAAALLSLGDVLSAPRLRWPELHFDLAAADVVFLEVPEVNLGRNGGSKRTSMEYDVFEISESVAPARKDEAVATKVTGSWVIRPFRIPLGAARGFEAIVRCRALGRPAQSSQRRIRWRAGPQGVWTFMRDRRGRWVCPPERSWRRPRNEVLYIVPPGMRLVCDGLEDSCRVVSETSMPDDWGGWTAFQVEGATGGEIRLETLEGMHVSGWSLGQRCEVSFDREDDAVVGRLILDRFCPVYGLKLPDVVVDALDPTLELTPDEWACEVQWNAGRESATVPVVSDNQGYRLRAVLQDVSDLMPGVVDDGVIRVSGPQSCASFRRTFARVPLERPRLVEIDTDQSGALVAHYLVGTDVDLSDALFNESVRVERREASQCLVAPASLDAVAGCFRDVGHRVSMNIALAGLSVVAEGVELPKGPDPLVIPEAGLARLSGAVVRIKVSRDGACSLTLELCADGQDTAQLRTVGANGSYADALGFGELQCMLPQVDDVTLGLRVDAGEATFRRPLFRILAGHGLGAVEVDRSVKPARLKCDRTAAVDMDVRLLDLTAPWRPELKATLWAGEAETAFEPAGFAFCEGRYGVWFEIADEWSADVDLSARPALTFTITQSDERDPLPAMGPYHKQLAQLLRHRAGLSERPSIQRRATQGTLHMLEADAEATVAALLHCLHPLGEGCAGLMGEGESIAGVGRDIMQLSEYRNALSPATLRNLIVAKADGWTVSDILSVMMALRIPLTDVRPSACALFEPDELQAAWKLHPYVGLLCSLMHSCAGRPDEAAEHVDRWLAEGTGIRREDLRREDLLPALEVDTWLVRQVVEGGRGKPSSPGLLETVFADWMRNSTQKQQVHVAQWVRENIEAVRHALRMVRPQAGPLSAAVKAVQVRDCGENIKTISNLPLISGALAVASLAHQVGHSATTLFAQALTSGRRDNVTHEALTELLIEGLQLCPEVVALDLFLVRLWWSMETGDL